MNQRYETKPIALTRDDFDRALEEVETLIPKAIELGKEMACDNCKEEWYTCDAAQDNYAKEALREIQKKFLSNGTHIPKSLGQCAMARWQKVVKCSQNKRITHDKATSSAKTLSNQQEGNSGSI